MQPSTPTLVSIINDSSTLSDEEVAHATSAFGKQLAQDVAPIWGMMPAVEFCPSGTKPSGNVLARIVDDLPEAPGALGYHDRDENGYAYIKVAVIPGYDWRTTMSHELLEMAVDAPANRWRDAPDGADYAEELCDAVQGDTYEIDGVPVSNFVYPAFFNPTANAADKFDHLGLLKKPFGMSPGGYQIKRSEPGQISQVYGRHAARSEDAREAIPSHRSRDGRCVFVVFGSQVPEDRKAAQLAKVARKYQ